MDDKEKWRAALIEALDVATEHATKPVAAARLRNVLGTVAKGQDLDYPPGGMVTGRFFEFITAFQDEVIYVRHSGGDLWVAPAGSPELLTATKPDGSQSQVGIRRDLFESFTTFDALRCAWYSPQSDTVLWQDITAPQLPAPWVQLPAAEIPNAIADRRAFIQTLEDPLLREQLTEAVSKPRGLADFATLVRERGLQPVWHRYWVKLLTDRIRDWANGAGLTWNSAWITTSPKGANSESQPKPAAAAVDREWRNNLAALFQALDEEDLQRISIPLDIVVRALKRT